jgi:hypothetical protein
MDSFPRNISLLAAAAIVAATLSGPLPAFAAEKTAVATDISAKASNTSVRRHGPTRLSHSVHHVKSTESNLGCSGAWCGRQFVLIVGIGY